MQTTPEELSDNYEVIVIGAGAAGASAAVALSRSLRRVLVIDAGAPRNAVSAHAHNVLGQEGVNPLELLARGRQEAIDYGAHWLEARAENLQGTRESGFTVQAAGRTFHGERVLLATGLSDQLPDIPGIAQAWGVSALHCPYCHGYEVRGEQIVVLGTGEMSAHQALMFRQLSEHVTYLEQVPGQLTQDDERRLAALSIEIRRDAVQRLDVDDRGQISMLHLASGATLPAKALVLANRLEANADLYVGLGGALAEHPVGRFIEVDQMQQTAIPGVYAAGNTSNLMHMVMAAAASGTMAGAAINAELIMNRAVVASGR
ncbi:NAD(P)/FAD-dependent oxidoreductase [Glutamicibacter sp. PS]|uniref:NAD(P)/FAD-dependent oxidoreductase n=1 Tax=Glutamicibacter sp. PS TaxID=3075634 RepID=UPI00283CFF68|nr:NAD(P)/FAD-dependent oxidoreductase [Glutamicibacter sp. PS]MDR4532686.1 NAD(P)/FAD-dependent oxidoreductase [Glutamicibacter sp. PS]